MAEHALSTYLNDHLAGSELGLELLEHLEHAFTGTPLAAFAANLRDEITDDRRELEDLMARLKIAQSRPRKAAAWVSEKITVLKLRLDDPSAGPLRRLELLEALSLGIEGKRSLWLSLAAASALNPGLAGTDFMRLERRAAEQRQGVETLRLDAAKAALGPDPEPEENRS